MLLVAATSAFGSRYQMGVNGLAASLAKRSTSLVPPSIFTGVVVAPMASTNALVSTTSLGPVSLCRSSTSRLLTCGVVIVRKSSVAVLITKLSVPVPPSMLSAASNTTPSLPAPALTVSAPPRPSKSSSPPSPCITAGVSPLSISFVSVKIRSAVPAPCSITPLSKSVSSAVTVTSAWRKVSRWK